MLMQLRSHNNKVPSSSGSADGSLEMDAQTGISNSIDNMSYSAKSHSSIQDAAESGHRSDSGNTAASRVPVGHSTLTSMGSHHADVSVQEAPIAPGPILINFNTVHGPLSVNSNASAAPIPLRAASETSVGPANAGHDNEGFVVPKRTSRASSVHSRSPGLISAPRYFDGHYLPEDDIKDVAPEELPLISWSDSSDDDGLGPSPPSWIKQELVSVELKWSPRTNVESNFSYNNLVHEIFENLTISKKEKLHRREANMRNVQLKSMNTHPLHGNAASQPYTSPASRTAQSTPCIPAAAKGKTRDFTTAPGIDYNKDNKLEEDSDAEAARDYQIQADTLLAMNMQQRFDKHTSGELPDEATCHESPRFYFFARRVCMDTDTS
ncbi:hypothetical protein B0H14DRAFT_3727381 [Mycena olivaceomarginata]|nr:hypothetical protein B0H14DRAFT_3727381 [Mycena olivaceomarginata]